MSIPFLQRAEVSRELAERIQGLSLDDREKFLAIARDCASMEEFNKRWTKANGH